MKDFVLIEPTNVKIIYARNFLLTLSAAFIKLAIKRNDDLVKRNKFLRIDYFYCTAVFVYKTNDL